MWAWQKQLNIKSNCEQYEPSASVTRQWVQQFGNYLPKTILSHIWTTDLFPWTVRTLPSLAIITRSVERDIFVPLTLTVIHLITPLNLYPVDFYRTSTLTCHQHFWAHHLSCWKT
jgi:hypothetical protein